MHPISLRGFGVLCASLFFLAHGLTTPNEQNHDKTVENYVHLEARRGRGGGSRRTRPKPQRNRPSKPKGPKKPKSKKIHRPKATKTQTKSKPTKAMPTKSSPPKITSKKPASKSTKQRWTTPAVSYPTTAINPCYLYIDCDEDALADGITARNVEYVVDLGITDAPAPTPTNYPSSGDLFKAQKKAHHHVFKFKSPNVDDAKVVAEKGAPLHTLDYAAEHILELQTVSRLLTTVVKKHPKLGPVFLRGWEKPLTAASVNSRKPKPKYELSGKTLTINNLIFNALGSNTNLDDFVICDAKINSYKGTSLEEDRPDEFVGKIWIWKACKR
ncbi:hypothetical protein BU23DRAFT_562509 [Bimuria novae-zelandiae CBS 107.79]|uniref:Uncharacterized protein n=1 Tax=Bimuria novae-zelandiae CBS 107.79 TaxID=1447943 RepID=A0A6A5VQW4_9PLEO|nr:hypothetical protein BU23DRAFT_562509 [Bimuria novae-zelandiae CBS 107.79]